MNTGHCPSCGAATQRVHRNAVDRWVSLFRSVHRYRCTNPECDWHGLLGSDPPSMALRAAHPRRARLIWFVLGAGFALAAAEGVRWADRTLTDSRRAAKAVPAPVLAAPRGPQAQALATPSGENFDGEELPDADDRVARNPSPLSLRRHCSWGVPGANRYRGTVEQALQAARLPPEVVREIAHKAQRGWTNGKVEIARTGIRSVEGGRYFGRSALAMGFGDTLCFDTRVNFKPGHVEYADLYQAIDGRGQSYAVMVPYVCQNVAVLGERAEEEEEGGGGTNGHSVPESATWSLALLALGALAWVRSRSPRAKQR